MDANCWHPGPRMTRPPDPHAPTVTMAPRRRRWWPWLLLAPLVLATAAVLAAPWLTCRIVAGRAPFPSGALLVHGARLGGSPPPAMVIATCDPATFRRICAGASGRWIPSVLLTDGQHAWGAFRDAPEVTWRLDLASGSDIPRIAARIPQGLAERLLARRLAADQAPVTDVRLRTCSLLGEPDADGTIQWQAQLSGSAAIRWGQQALPVVVDDAQTTAVSRLGVVHDGRRPVTAEVRIAVLRGTAPLLGDLAPLSGTLEKQANQRLGQELPKTLVPDWWPSATRWDLRTVPSAMTEF